jgi:hypothetical protein
MGAREVAQDASTTRDAVAASLRDLTRRVENYQPFPLTALEAIAAIRRHLVDFEFAAISAARERGATWGDVADALGISRQGAQVRFSKQREAGPDS